MMADKRKGGMSHEIHGLWYRLGMVAVLVLSLGGIFYCGIRSNHFGESAETVTGKTDESGEPAVELDWLSVVQESFTPESTSTRLRAIYRDERGDLGYLTDGAFVQYYQEHRADKVYFSNEWTVNEVVDSYYEHPEIWSLYHNDWWCQDFIICFTPDYRYCFELDFDDMKGDYRTGWLLVNGVRVAMLDEKTLDSVYPEDLLALYLSGEWDGEWLTRSSDGGVRVYIDSDGALRYRADVRRYTVDEDPYGLAYDDYNIPWWKDADEYAKYEFYTDYAPIDSEYDAEDLWLLDSFTLNVYPDLPRDFDTGTILMSNRWRELGTIVMTKDGAMLFKRGRQLNTWVFDQTIPEERYPSRKIREQTMHDCQVMICWNDNEPDVLAHFYDGQRILNLLTDGQIEVAVDELLLDDSEWYQHLSWSSRMFGMKDDTLLICDFYNEQELQVLATDVISVDFNDMRTFEKADGLYAVTQDPENNYQDVVVYLGTEPKQYYLDYYNTLDWAVYMARYGSD